MTCRSSFFRMKSMQYILGIMKELGIKAKIASGEQFGFDNVDALFDKLEAE